MKKTILFILILIINTYSIRGKEAYFKHLSTTDGSSLSSAISIWQDHFGTLWIGNSLLNKYDGNTLKTYRLSECLNKPQDINISQIQGGSNSIIYIFTEPDLLIFDTYSGKFHDPGIEAGCIYYHNDKLYFASANVVYTYNHSTDEITRILETPDPKEVITCMYAVEQDKIWIGTNKTLYRVEEKEVSPVIHSINISCLYIDSKKNVWAGTVDDGVRMISSDATNKIITIKEDKEIDKGYRLSNNRIRCINEDNKQNIWIGTYGGITLLSPESKDSYFFTHHENIPYSLQHNSIYSIYKDRQGTMWVGTYYGGVSFYNPNVELYKYYGTSQTDKDMLNGYIIGNMTEDNSHNLYIATEEGGVNKQNRITGEVKRYNKENGALPHNTIKSIWYDKEHKQLFAGTFTQGLLVKKHGSEIFEPIGEGVLSNSRQKIISKILPYNKEYILIVTQEEVYKLDRKTYDITPLLPNKELNYAETGIIHTLFLDNNDILWVSSFKKGIFRINLKTYHAEYFNDTEEYSEVRGSTVRQIIRGTDNNIYLLAQSALLAYNEATKTLRTISKIDRSLVANTYYHMARLKSGRLIITADNTITLLDPRSHASFTLSLSNLSFIKSINESCGLYVSPLNEEIFIGSIGGMISLFEEDIITMTTPDYPSYRLYLSSLSINNKPVNTLTRPDILKEDISYSKSITLNYKLNNINISFASSDYIHDNNIVYEYMLENFDRQWITTKDKTIRYTSLPPGNYNLKIREQNNTNKKTELALIIAPPFYASLWAYILYALAASLLLLYILRFTRKNALLKASLQVEVNKKANLEKLNKIKQNFFTNVSHEFRTPLTLILSQLDIALKEEGLQRSIKNRLQKIKKHTNEMRHLINELTHLSKMEQGYFPIKVSQQDISLFIKDIYVAFKEYAQIRNITFKGDFSEEPINVWFDYVQLQKVIYNLLSNAFKFTHEGGTITISLKHKKDAVEIAVEDNGMGIEKENLNEIFEQFYQVSQGSTALWMEGMGVGLSLSKEIVRQHSGDIFVESKPGEMTRFTVRLLLGDAHFTKEQKEEWILNENIYMPKPSAFVKENGEERMLQSSEKSGKTILIIEDNEGLLEVLEEAFATNYRVITSSNGEDGLHKAIELLPDLILTDIMLPGLSGLEVCKKLKTHIETSHIPIILLTAHASLKQNIEGLQYGADDYITKPFDMDLLLLKCHNLIKNRTEIKQIAQHITPEDSKEEILATNKADQRFLEEAIEVAEKYIPDSDFDTTMWSKELKIGRSKLFQKIKEITGYTPNEYLLILRMKKATTLLKEYPNLTIAEIAYQLGFSSPGYFSKCFKEQFGVTPMQYRNS